MCKKCKELEEQRDRFARATISLRETINERNEIIVKMLEDYVLREAK